jgi:DNA-directed RNA polymerase specialized sigma24 family protein
MTPILAGQRPAARPTPRPGGKPLIAAAYAEHADALAAYIRDVLGADDPRLARDAEDVAADAWLRVTEHADRVDDRVLDLDYLRLIARASARRHREARGPELPVGLPVAPSREAGVEETVLDSLAGERRPLPRRRRAQAFRPSVPAAVKAVAA